MSNDVESAQDWITRHEVTDVDVAVAALEARDRLIAAARDEEWRKAYSGRGAGPMLGPQSPEELPGFLEGRDSVTRELERERCARVCDSHAFALYDTARQDGLRFCAAAIRALPDREPAK